MQWSEETVATLIILSLWCLRPAHQLRCAFFFFSILNECTPPASNTLYILHLARCSFVLAITCSSFYLSHTQPPYNNLCCPQRETIQSPDQCIMNCKL